MSLSENPVVTIAHQLPGRVRLRLSHPIANVPRMQRMIREHPGIESLEYSSVTRSVLVVFSQEEVSAEEIIVRVALSLALDRGGATVRILAQPETHEMSDSAFYSGVLVLAALLRRWMRLGRDGSALLEWAAGLSTTAAAVEHGWTEYRQRGNFDPEVLSVTYLVASLVRGNILPATIVTWVTAFGRHLLHMPAPGVELRPTELSSGKSGTPGYEVLVGADRGAPDKMALFGVVPTALFKALTGGAPTERGDLLTEIRRVSSLHGEVLEGLGEFRRGIPLRVR